jgi:hypothetical protein
VASTRFRRLCGVIVEDTSDGRFSSAGSASWETGKADAIAAESIFRQKVPLNEFTKGAENNHQNAQRVVRTFGY